MPTVSVEMSEKEYNLICSFAKKKGITLDDLFKSSVLEIIENDTDLDLFNEGMRDFEKNPVSYSHEEVKNMLRGNINE